TTAAGGSAKMPRPPLVPTLRRRTRPPPWRQRSAPKSAPPLVRTETAAAIRADCSTEPGFRRRGLARARPSDRRSKRIPPRGTSSPRGVLVSAHGLDDVARANRDPDAPPCERARDGTDRARHLARKPERPRRSERGAAAEAKHGGERAGRRNAVGPMRRQRIGVVAQRVGVGPRSEPEKRQ